MSDTQYFNELAESWLGVFLAKAEAIRQGWGELRSGADVLGTTPLRICGKDYSAGFGTHADSRIRIRSRKPLARIHVFGGISENKYTVTGNEKISPLIFAVEQDGKVLQESAPVCFGGLAELDVPLCGATEFDLTVRTTGTLDNAYANWCNPRLETVDGEAFFAGCGVDFPVSFRYDGKSAEEFISENGISYSVREEKNCFLHEFVSASESLRMIFTCKAFKEFPALEYHLAFENPSAGRSGRLSQVRSLKMNYAPGTMAQVLRHHGAFHRTNETYTHYAFRDSFRPVWWEPTLKEELRFQATGGRSSVDWMPYFDIPDGKNNLRIAIGWSGQWNTNILWDEKEFHIDAGIETFDAVLEGGEHLEFPSIILQRTTEGGREAAVNIWRRFVTSEIMLPLNGKPPVTPTCTLTWGGRKESEHLRKLEYMDKENIPIEVYWIDAGWFAPENRDEFSPVWGSNVGDWDFDPVIYPDELRNIAEKAHKSGRKLLLWVEPERIIQDRKFAKDHPEYLLDYNNAVSKLLNLGNPDAWQACFDKMSGIIERNRLDWFRVDFNFSPLPYWHQNDAEDRKGISEVRYVNGLYRFWRELRKKFPGLMIDDCASGGRRLDFEFLRYSLPLFCSDMHCFPGVEPRFSQTHRAGLSDYWPRFSCGSQNQTGGDTYNFRSVMHHGAVIHYNTYCYNDLESYPYPWLRERMAEHQKIRDCFAGDFYELNAPCPDETSMTVLQYDLPEEQRGVITVFRGEKCPEVERIIIPRGLCADCDYMVSDADASFEPFRIRGEKWMQEGFALRIAAPRTARLISYKQV